MKAKLQALWVRMTSALPEILLVLFVLALVPAVVLGILRLADGVFGVLAHPGRFVREIRTMWPPVVGTALLLAGGALLVFELATHWGRIWAVARKMIIEALNRKVVVVLLLFFIVLAPSLPFVLEAEQGQLKSEVQMILLYSMALSLVLMSLVAILLSTASISSEVELRQVHITDTKPMKRWQFLVGKWFGVIVLCGVVLFAIGGVGYGLVRYTAAMRPRPEDRAEGAARAPREERYDPVEEEVFTARRAVPAQFDASLLEGIDEYEEEAVQRWRQNMVGGRKAAEWSRRMAARTEYYSMLLTAQPGRTIVLWEFPRLDPDKPVTLRFKARQMGSTQVMGQMVVCDEVERKDAEGNVLGTAYRAQRDQHGGLKMVSAPPTGWPGGTWVEEELPPGSVSEDGWLYVRFEPRHMLGNPAGSVQFDIAEGGLNPEPAVQALQPQGTFVGNYYRSLLILLCHVGVLAAFGVLAGALFSFPVAALMVMVLFLGGLMVPWFSENFIEPTQYVRLTPSEAVFDAIWRGFARVMIWPLPNFGEYSPMDNLVNGRMVGWDQVSMAGGLLLVLKGGLALLIAAYFYTRRELARIVV